MTDEDLVVSYIEGDDSAFVTLMDRYLKLIYSFTFRMCKNTDNAEEITQETFLKVWKNIKKFKTNQKFKTWIYTIAKNTAIDYLRKRRDVLFSAFENDEGINLIEEMFSPFRQLGDNVSQKNINGYLFCTTMNTLV